MKLANPITLAKASEILSCSFVGNPELVITGLNEIHVVEEGDIVFVDHKKYYDAALQSKASVILIDKEVACPEGKGLLISNTPFDDFNFLTRQFSPTVVWEQPIAADLKIGTETIIHPNVTIGNNVTIGANSMIHSGVVLMDNTIIGNNVIIQANTVIGSHAFYYKQDASGRKLMHTCGRVVIEDKVEIGALCTIDAGVTSDTVIGEGSKLDNQIHVGHDTKIGKNCLFAAQVGIAGCVIIKDNVTLWGQVGIASDLTIGEGAVLYGQAGVGKSIPGGKSYIGSPCGESRVKFKEMAALRSLPNIIEQLF